ncbi:mitochondrial import inner membrane translocase subunit Tim23B isoform X1 [Pygocentrus nattereri]|uniref:Mitochondrial import inner membrane translocase subunit TIM23 n=1 Tax=Pygocentrus nattereri TaxID=42514 RepID=A0AAR2M269_PYGNA|nr:mitochondrial import inner membrane translocase subunit Tim23B isoform X1 [Pygocentrus nattereri]
MDSDSGGSPSSQGSSSMAGGGGGFGGLFRSSGPGYSNSELAGVPLTGMSPLSPYLNVDPRYLTQDADEFILPTGANKTRGRFELAFFTIGSCCMTGALFGAINGLRMGLSETKNMAWSKPRNVQVLNLVTRQSATWANTLGSLALLYSVFGVVVEKARGAEDDLNTVAAGTMTGMLYKSPERTLQLLMLRTHTAAPPSPLWVGQTTTWYTSAPVMCCW